MARVRDDLCITIPAFFRCPISLDVMKSPVSLCTGATYDRSSIQQWLEKGNNTCPLTMQVLQSKEFVPNRNLQRLIKVWSDSVDSQADFAESSFLNSDALEEQATELIEHLATDKSESSCSESLSKLICFARESEGNRTILGKMDQLVLILVEFLGNVNGRAGGNINLIEQAVTVLGLIRNEIEDKETWMNSILKDDRDCLSSLLFALKQGSVDSQIGSVSILESIAINAEAKLRIAEKEGLLAEIINSIGKEKNTCQTESVLSCLISISTLKCVKIKSVHLGIIKSLTKLLAEPNSTANVSTTQKALKLLEMASSVKDGRSEICANSDCVAAILQKLLKVSNQATEHAVTILWSVCYLFRDPAAQEAVTKANGLTKILLLIQSNCSPPIRQMAMDLLKIFRINSKSCLSSYDTKTTHIMPC